MDADDVMHMRLQVLVITILVSSPVEQHNKLLKDMPIMNGLVLHTGDLLTADTWIACLSPAPDP